jgi:hypothetical protein
MRRLVLLSVVIHDKCLDSLDTVGAPIVSYLGTFREIFSW